MGQTPKFSQNTPSEFPHYQSNNQPEYLNENYFQQTTNIPQMVNVPTTMPNLNVNQNVQTY